MKNFIFLSPNFPDSYWMFCYELKKNGLRVLGIGDCPYEGLRPELKESLNEYYKVSSLENCNEVYRAVAFLTFKYGKIDWLESNNEYWLERDAALRTEFNITTGPQTQDMARIKCKSVMKNYYAKAGVPTCRYHLCHEYEEDKSFAHMVGYPVVVKPDSGIGANKTYKLGSDADLDYFYASKDNETYIMEEFVKGEIRTYDAIIDSNGDPLFETGNVTLYSPMDIVNTHGNCCYYIVKELPEDMRDLGKRCTKAFGLKSRFVHLEFFVSQEDQWIDKKGNILGLEVNMRPSGGYSTDMYNFANECNVYKIWADMIAFDTNTTPMAHPKHFTAFCGRRTGKHFKMDHDEIIAEYGTKMKMVGHIPKMLSSLMGNYMYIANFDTEEEVRRYYKDLLEEF